MAESFEALSQRYRGLRIAVVGDFCLDRYLEIDPTRAEVSLETGLTVHNVVCVRAQPGGAGNVAANLSALGVGRIDAVGVRGDDGEGYELQRTLQAQPALDTTRLLQRSDRHTFTYTKPMLCEPGRPQRELARLDLKNWSSTPPDLVAELARAVAELAEEVDAMILLDQVELADSGVVTAAVRDAASSAATRRPALLVLADSRRGTGDFPPMGFKTNAAEFARAHGMAPDRLDEIASAVGDVARGSGHPVFVTLAEHGIVGSRGGEVLRVPALPVKPPIDIVGAGDAVTANLAAALAAGGSLELGMRAAMAAAAVVVHQLGTTGAATPEQVAQRLADAVEPVERVPRSGRPSTTS